jgi:DNA polymerase III delta prime subunit
MRKHAVLLSGPIGVGKTTLGRALASDLGGGFIDGDHHADHTRPWYCSILQTSRSILETSLMLLKDRPLVAIAYPLRCSNWIYFRRRFAEAGIRPTFVNLSASFDAIVSPARNRQFSAGEKARIQAMIDEGYSEWAFGDITIETGNRPLELTMQELKSKLVAIIGVQ